MDLAGVAPDSVKVVFVRNTLVIVGHKRPATCEDRHAAFHLAERTFGRFARGVRLAGAFDAGRADATLKAGELRVGLPRIEERRGGEHPHSDRDRLTCASCSSATSSASRDARSRSGPSPRSSSSATSTSSSPTSRTPPPASASPATSPTPSSSYGVDVMTSGNHVWDKKEVLDYIPRQPKLLRPANFPAGVPGRGSYLGRTRTGEPVGVINVMGRIFMAPLDDPFAVALREIEALRAKARVIIVDFHAEATSEKVAMGWHLDGRVTAVFGTHTHVQTADERILPKGTAYLTDVGMTGPHDSIIGVTVEAALVAVSQRDAGQVRGRRPAPAG